MTEPDLIQRERTLLRELFRLSGERAAAEVAADPTSTPHAPWTPRS